MDYLKRFKIFESENNQQNWFVNTYIDDKLSGQIKINEYENEISVGNIDT
jgi:hypothetical protein